MTRALEHQEGPGMRERVTSAVAEVFTASSGLNDPNLLVHVDASLDLPAGEPTTIIQPSNHLLSDLSSALIGESEFYGVARDRIDAWWQQVGAYPPSKDLDHVKFQGEILAAIEALGHVVYDTADTLLIWQKTSKPTLEPDGTPQNVYARAKAAAARVLELRDEAALMGSSTVERRSGNNPAAMAPLVKHSRVKIDVAKRCLVAQLQRWDAERDLENVVGHDIRGLEEDIKTLCSCLGAPWDVTDRHAIELLDRLGSRLEVDQEEVYRGVTNESEKEL